MTEAAVHGSLFAVDFLNETIKTLPEWSEFDDARLDGLSSELQRFFNNFPTSTRPNESQTENDLIWPILERLGWTQSLRNQNLTAYGRDDVPDGLLFLDAAAKARANTLREEWRRYEFGRAIVEFEALGSPARSAIGNARRRNGAVDANAALSQTGRRLDKRRIALGRSHQRRAVASLLSGRALGLRKFLRNRPRLAARAFPATTADCSRLPTTTVATGSRSSH